MVNVLGCPRCGDQTLWSHNQGRAWCRLCGHTWTYCRLCGFDPNPDQPCTHETPEVFVCVDPEGDWIRDQQKGSDDRND